MKQDFFHDAVITEFQIHNGDIKMQIEKVQTEDDLSLESGLLTVTNVSLLLEDDKPIKITNRRIGLDDGDIYCCSRLPDVRSVSDALSLHQSNQTQTRTDRSEALEAYWSRRRRTRVGCYVAQPGMRASAP